MKIYDEVYEIRVVSQNLTHFVVQLLHFKIVTISYAKAFILKLRHKGKK